MRRPWLAVLALGAAAALAQSLAPTPEPALAPTPVPVATCPPLPGSSEQLRAHIESHLGRPYVWGATGMKSFDCSGFVWRTMLEQGVFLKRTTARKYFVSLRKVDEQHKWEFSNLVFFDDFEHMGIVNDKNTFYHAQCTRGTNLSSFDPFWRAKICGFRVMPVSGLQGPLPAGFTPPSDTSSPAGTPTSPEPSPARQPAP